MIIVTRRKLVIFLFFSVLFITSLIHGGDDISNVFSGKITRCIIIDAGHGFPDGGAIGARGTVECTLNIKIAKKIKKELAKKGFRVIMTRSGENCLADKNGTISEKKRIDMHKRLDIINNSNADLFVSIHMNKFRDSRYRGAQVIYSGNFTQSLCAARFIQSELNKLRENNAERTQLQAPSSIFLLRNAEIPALIVECGFLSNFEEEELLSDASYQTKLAKAIAKGIENYYQNQFEGIEQ